MSSACVFSVRTFWWLFFIPSRKLFFVFGMLFSLYSCLCFCYLTPWFDALAWNFVFLLIFYSILSEAYFFCSLGLKVSVDTYSQKKKTLERISLRNNSEGKKMKRTKVISLWHKWPARSVDKRRILMAKSLCLFASLCSFCVQVEKQNAHWIMQCHFMKNESTFLRNITNGIFRVFFFSLLLLFFKSRLCKWKKKNENFTTYHICSSPITQMQITGKQNEAQRNNIYNKNRRFV